MTLIDTAASAPVSPLETDSYSMLPEIVGLGNSLFSQRSLAEETGKAFMKNCLHNPEEMQTNTSLFESAVESCFSELFNFCRNTVFKRCRNLPLAEEIAQESILYLLKTKTAIEQLKPWLFRVSINNLADHYRNQEQEDSLRKQLMIELELLDSISSSSFTDDQYSLLASLPALQQSPEFMAFKRLAECKDLQEFARQKELTIDQAKKASVKIKHDLRSLYLRQSGWEAGLEILPYQKYMILKHFVNSLVKPWENESIKTMRKYSSEVSMEKLRLAFDGITTVDYWDLVHKGAGLYHVYVFCLNPSAGPLLTTVKFKFNSKNRIVVEECGKNVLAGVYKKPDNFRLPLEKGKLMYSFLKVKSLLETIAEYSPENTEQKVAISVHKQN